MKAENVVCCLLTAGVIAADQAAKASVKKKIGQDHRDQPCEELRDGRKCR